DIEQEASCVIVNHDPHFKHEKLAKAINYLADPNCGFFVTNEDANLPNENCPARRHPYLCRRTAHCRSAPRANPLRGTRRSDGSISGKGSTSILRRAL
ncbi:hypothetical protein PENTCL1PPCAC_19098, partial [Pristionchus entomophagus]